MRLRNKKILLISPERWDHIFVSKHHYAIHLGKRSNDVFFLNPPADSEGCGPTKFLGVQEVQYKGFPTGLRFYPSFLRKRIMRNIYQKLSQLCSTEFNVVWSFDNSVFFDFSFLPPSILKISHIVDYSQNFETAKAASTADYCFCTSDSIRRNLERYTSRVHKINHGFHLQQSSLVALVGGNRKKAVYAGNLLIPYIDWNLFLTVVNQHPDVDFLFIGPYERATSRLPGPDVLLGKKNVFFIGQVESQELCGYYELADVLLINYREEYQEQQATNPHKMMEYLGSGKVIVATRTMEFDNLFPMVVMSERNSQWPALFAQVLEGLPHYNSESLRNQRRSFALANSYDMQIDKIEQIITD